MTDIPDALSMVGAAKSFGHSPVLQDFDLTVPRGGITAILGNSGSGKTTLLNLVAGFLTLDAGVLHLDGRLVDDHRKALPPQRRGVGYVPQDAALFPHLTVTGNVGFGVPRGRRGSVGELIELIGMTDYAHRYPYQLSGGQRQRVALARALAVEPGLVLLDEPFASLDATLRDSLRTDVVAILRARSATAIIVTHDRDEALALADEIAVIDGGRVRARGTPKQLYERPPTPDLAERTGPANILPGRLRIRHGSAQVETLLGQVAVPDTVTVEHIADGAACHVLVRPESIEIGGEHCYPATGVVISNQYLGGSARLSIDVAGMPPLDVRTAGALAPDIGDVVTIRLRHIDQIWPTDNSCS